MPAAPHPTPPAASRPAARLATATLIVSAPGREPRPVRLPLQQHTPYVIGRDHPKPLLCLPSHDEGSEHSRRALVVTYRDSHVEIEVNQRNGPLLVHERSPGTREHRVEKGDPPLRLGPGEWVLSLPLNGKIDWSCGLVVTAANPGMPQPRTPNENETNDARMRWEALDDIGPDDTGRWLLAVLFTVEYLSNRHGLDSTRGYPDQIALAADIWWHHSTPTPVWTSSTVGRALNMAEKNLGIARSHRNDRSAHRIAAAARDRMSLHPDAVGWFREEFAARAATYRAGQATR